jgi:hypothetical protein
MRPLDAKGQISWKASPAVLRKLADAEREVTDEDLRYGDCVETSMWAGLTRSPKNPVAYSEAALIARLSAPRTGRCTDRSYLMIIRRGDGPGVLAGGEIVKVTQVFQPFGRFSAANSL